MSSARLGFSMWSPGDIDLAISLWGDPRVTRFIGGPFTKAQVRVRLELEVTTQEAQGVQYWPIFRLVDGVHVGCCGLHPYREVGVLEIGFQLRDEHYAPTGPHHPSCVLGRGDSGKPGTPR